MRKFQIAIVSFLVATGIGVAQPYQRRREPSAPADAASVDAIVSALYGSVSHAADARPDFDRLRAIFLYVGMLVPPKAAGEDFRAMDVDQFAERYEKSVASKKDKGEAATGFFEREIARRTDCFGNVCQVFSTYESRHAANDPTPFQRGINSIQLLRDGSRWWIASVVWDAERPDNPIPAPYLPSK
jgi:hypothetical protein